MLPYREHLASEHHASDASRGMCSQINSINNFD
jgi:hypothetical protein